MESNTWYKLRRSVYNNLHNEEYESRLSHVINIFLIVLIIGNTAAVLLESINDLYLFYQGLFDAFELFSIAIFSLEYLLRFWAVAEKDPFQGAWKNRWVWIRSGSAIIDLMAILPAYINFFVHIDLRILRILRLFRLLKLTRYFVSLQILLRVIKREKGAFQAVIFILLIMIIIAAAGVYVVENKAQPEVFSSIPASMWWAVVTLTTVGYGDVTPITPLGRFLGALITILGVGLAALPAGILANGLAYELRQRKHQLELKFRELVDQAEIDLLEDQEKIEALRKEVGLNKEQTRDVLMELIHEHQQEEIEQQKNKYFFCPHCGHKLPD